MAEWTVEDLRKARLPAAVWRELLALHLSHAVPNNARLVDLTLASARDLASEFTRHGHRWTPEYVEDLRVSLLIFETAELDKRKIPLHRWPVLEVVVSALEGVFRELAAERSAPDRQRWEDALRPWWRPKGGGHFPPHLVDTLLTKHRRPFPRAIEFVPTLHRIDPNHLRREIIAWRKKVKATRARLAR